MPRTRTYAGLLSTRSHGDADDVLLLSSLSYPLADELEWMSGETVTVRYWITDRPCSRDEAQTAFLRTLHGTADVEYRSRYSELTGYLWTDANIVVGGHDLLAELTSHVGQWLIMEVEAHRAGAIP